VAEGEEEDVSSYGMTLKKQEDNGNRKSKHWVELYRTLFLKKDMDVS
jgi:hypothetical protein